MSFIRYTLLCRLSTRHKKTEQLVGLIREVATSHCLVGDRVRSIWLEQNAFLWDDFNGACTMLEMLCTWSALACLWSCDLVLTQRSQVRLQVGFLAQECGTLFRYVTWLQLDSIFGSFWWVFGCLRPFISWPNHWLLADTTIQSCICMNCRS